MKNTIKYLLLIIASAMLTSCLDKSYYGVLEIKAEEQTREPVLIFLGNTGYVLNAKGQGMIDGRSHFATIDPDVYVYSFKNGVPFTSVPSSVNDACLIDRSLDETSHPGGRKGTVSYPDYCITWRNDNPTKPLLYPLGTDEYEFYVYYTGGIDIPADKFIRTEDSVSFPIELDGTEDMMSGYVLADLETHKYSNYSAKLGIAPSVTLKHHLANINVELYPDEQGCHTVTIRKIIFQGIKYDANFTVVDRQTDKIGLTFSDKRKDYYLKEADGSDLKQDYYHTSPDADFSKLWYLRDHIKIGSSLMIYPSNDNLNLRINLWDSSLDNVEGLSKADGIDIDLALDAPEGGFEAGKSYTIRLKAQKQSPVIFDPDVDPWN